MSTLHISRTDLIPHIVASALVGSLGFILGRIYKLVENTTARNVEVPIWLFATLTASAILAILFSAAIVWRQKARLSDGLSIGAFQREAKSCQEIRILNTFLPQPERIAKIVSTAAARGAQAQILLLNPYCKVVKFREATLPPSERRVAQQIISTIEAFAKASLILPGSEANIKICVCDLWVPFSLYSTDTEASIGYFIIDGLAVNGPQLSLRESHPMFSDFTHQFDTLWGRAHRPLNLHGDWRRQLSDMRSSNVD
jgi:hypothetical protein